MVKLYSKLFFPRQLISKASWGDKLIWGLSIHNHNYTVICNIPRRFPQGADLGRVRGKKIKVRREQGLLFWRNVAEFSGQVPERAGRETSYQWFGKDSLIQGARYEITEKGK